MPSRNPRWSRDELILALDLYFRFSPRRISKTHTEVIRLSEILNRLPIHNNRPDSTRFRNLNGVYMKLCNFLRLDPSYTGKGLSRGNKDEETVWNEYADDPQRLSRVAKSIRTIANSQKIKATLRGSAEQDEEASSPEGRVLYRLHRARERNASLAKKKKASVLRASGSLECEACGFVFAEVYGSLGEGFIECHHNVPLSELKPNASTRLSDLSLVCSNCHRMLHRGNNTRALDSLREIVQFSSTTQTKTQLPLDRSARAVGKKLSDHLKALGRGT